MYGYAVMKLLPNQLKTISIDDFLQMYIAFKNLENKNFDSDMSRLAWQTALIMNSSGRYKKQIKPTDLYKSIEVETSKPKKEEKSIDELREELKASFGI